MFKYSKYLIKAICLRIHDIQSIGQVVVGLDTGKEGWLDGDFRSLDCKGALAVNISHRCGVHLTVECWPQALSA